MRWPPYRYRFALESSLVSVLNSHVPQVCSLAFLERIQLPAWFRTLGAFHPSIRLFSCTDTAVLLALVSVIRLLLQHLHQTVVSTFNYVDSSSHLPPVHILVHHLLWWFTVLLCSSFACSSATMLPSQSLSERILLPPHLTSQDMSECSSVLWGLHKCFRHRLPHRRVLRTESMKSAVGTRDVRKVRCRIARVSENLRRTTCGISCVTMQW